MISCGDTFLRARLEPFLPFEVSESPDADSEPLRPSSERGVLLPLRFRSRLLPLSCFVPLSCVSSRDFDLARLSLAADFGRLSATDLCFLRDFDWLSVPADLGRLSAPDLRLSRDFDFPLSFGLSLDFSRVPDLRNFVSIIASFLVDFDISCFHDLRRASKSLFFDFSPRGDLLSFVDLRDFSFFFELSTSSADDFDLPPPVEVGLKNLKPNIDLTLGGDRDAAP